MGELFSSFRKASQFDPLDQPSKDLLQSCLQAGRRPKARWPFREGAWKAWEAFSKQQPAILKQLEAERAGRCSRKLERMVSVSLEPAFSKPECIVWKTDGKPILVCNTSEAFGRTAEILQFFRQAPAEIREVWDFQIGPLPDQSSSAAQAFLRQYGDQPVSLYTMSDGTPCGAEVMGVPLNFLAKKMLPEPAMNRFYTNLQSYLGYIPIQHLQRFIPAKSRPSHIIPIRELPQVLRDSGVNCSEESAEALMELLPYDTSFAPDNRKFWRQGKESGVVRISSTILDPNARGLAFNNETVQDGVEGGYLVWPITNGFKKKVQEETVQFQTQIQGWLLEQLGAETYYPMGRATDLNFAYLDFIAWDLQPVLETAAKLLQKAGIPWAAYRPYRDWDPAISLFNFDAPPLQQS